MGRRRAGRPQNHRCVEQIPEVTRFKPAGVPVNVLSQVRLTVDELEAIRLADFEGLYQEQAAERLKVSRQTFGRIIAAARKKVAQALIDGRGLQIEGGPVKMMGRGWGRGRGLGGGGRGRRRGRGWYGR